MAESHPEVPLARTQRGVTVPPRRRRACSRPFLAGDWDPYLYDDSERPRVAAVLYAQLGFPVIPLTWGVRKPALFGWREAATTDIKRVSAWWRRTYGGCGIGIVPGEFFVLEIMRGKLGHDVRASLVAEHGSLPPTAQFRSPEGDQYHLFRDPGSDGVWSARAIGNRPGLNVLGSGGYIVVPPTIHPTGRRYEWLPGHALGEIEVADSPEWLLALIDPPVEDPFDLMDWG